MIQWWTGSTPCQEYPANLGRGLWSLTGGLVLRSIYEGAIRTAALSSCCCVPLDAYAQKKWEHRKECNLLVPWIFQKGEVPHAPCQIRCTCLIQTEKGRSNCCNCDCGPCVEAMGATLWCATLPVAIGADACCQVIACAGITCCCSPKRMSHEWLACDAMLDTITSCCTTGRIIETAAAQ